MPAEGFGRYYRRVLSQVRKDLKPRLEWAVVGAIVGFGGAVLIEAFALAPKGQITLRVLVASIPIIVILVVYFGFHALRAPWRIYNETESSVQSLTAALEASRDAAKKTVEAHVVKIKSLERQLADSGPRITVEYQKTPLFSGLFLKSDKDALNVTISPVGGKRYVLDAKPIPILRANEPAPLDCYSVSRSKSTSREMERFGSFVEAFNDYREDEWNARIPLEIKFWDRGNQFSVRWFVVWERMRENLDMPPEVIPDPESYRWIDQSD
jgi:hypothetical protein